MTMLRRRLINAIRCGEVIFMPGLRPYYLKNKEWYTKDENGNDVLTDKAPKKARDSFIEFWGSDDPEKRSMFYFLSNPEWYTINPDISSIHKGKRAFKLTRKAPPEARFSYKLYYTRQGCKRVFGMENGKPYYLTDPRWYTFSSDCGFQFTEAAPPAAVASFHELR